MREDIDTSKFWCWHEDCSDYGKRGAGNIVFKERYGKRNLALLKCRTCGHCFSESKGTPFFGLKTSFEEVADTLSSLPEKGSIRGLARSSRHGRDTISRWIKAAGKHSKQFNDYFLRDLELNRIQIDEIWSFIKKGEEHNT